jgi:hypothetical protein
MNTVLMDIMVYLVYVSIVILISYGNRDGNMFYMKNNLETTLIHGGLRCGWTEDAEPCDKDEDLPMWDNPYNGRHEPNYWVDFMKVRDVNQWWLWFSVTLMPNVRVQEWYNGDPPYGLRGYLDDRVNRIIGYTLVRQIREMPGNCRSPILMREYVDSCTGDLVVRYPTLKISSLCVRPYICVSSKKNRWRSTPLQGPDVFSRSQKSSCEATMGFY